MTHISLAPQDQLGDLEAFAKEAYDSMGYIPNTVLAMAHRPEIARGYLTLVGNIMHNTTIEPALITMIAQVASTAAGCRYCQAHAAQISNTFGTDADKVAAVWDFETDSRFSAAERAALRLARDGALVPNCVTAEHFTELRQHFDEGQIVEIVASIALMGFLNRWNDTLAMELEQIPLDFASRHLHGWSPGRHAPVA
ncbi:MAG: carboxymuconolactone decarboxylase family protein [Chloroflexales bacterium]|nr:carboxymuconolactone decarboxylase family protein [Chloroflexales bacterium]